MRAGIRWFIADLWDGLRARRGRTALALFAIGVGMVSLTLLVAVLGGLQRRAHEIVQELGARVIAVAQHGAPGQGRHVLDLAMADVLRRSLPDCRLSVVRYDRSLTQGVEQPVSVMATDQHLASVRNWSIQDGRWLDRTDLEERQRHTVISQELAERHGWTCGQIVLVHDTPFTIVGICGYGGGTLSGAAPVAALNPGPQALFVPVTIPPYWEQESANRSDQLDAIFFQSPTDRNVYAVRQTAQRILQAPSLAAGPLAWLTPDVLLAGLHRLQRMVRLTAGSIACLCLVLGGTTLMSLMVAAVRERVQEIGLRQSLGATPGDIARLFTAEACLITLMASLAGIAFAHLLLWTAAGRLPVPVALGPSTLLIPLGSSLVLGVLFAYAPARGAAGIVPAEALRNA